MKDRKGIEEEEEEEEEEEGGEDEEEDDEKYEGGETQGITKRRLFKNGVLGERKRERKRGKHLCNCRGTRVSGYLKPNKTQTSKNKTKTTKTKSKC